MGSPLPKHLRSEKEYKVIPKRLRNHIVDLEVDRSKGVRIPGAGKHRAKFAPGLPSVLIELAESNIVGDPMAGTGMLAWETGLPLYLNDIDPAMMEFLSPLSKRGCKVSISPASSIKWRCQVCIFSPPYYPKTDRKRANAHNDEKRGPVVGFRDSYDAQCPNFIGNPGGVNAIKIYREQMTQIYNHLHQVCSRMIVVTKNWTRQGTEMRLDLDTILMAQSSGWECIKRHGWVPPPSLWARYNANRGGGVPIEDILIFNR